MALYIVQWLIITFYHVPDFSAVWLCTGVEFGARMITIDGKQIKLQIWDTVCGMAKNWEWRESGLLYAVMGAFFSKQICQSLFEEPESVLEVFFKGVHGLHLNRLRDGTPFIWGNIEAHPAKRQMS